VSKVPLLGDIPLLGYLFKSKSVKREKTNLILLLTPRVIRDSRDQAETTDKQRSRFIDALQRTDAIDIKAEVGKKPGENGSAPHSERK
jgi:general secretion pathway protein D